MIPVKSAAVEAIGHDGTHLHVTYAGGKTYIHHNVSQELFDDLVAAPSKGQFLNRHIRTQHPGTHHPDQTK
jgi:hypothetical protein